MGGSGLRVLVLYSVLRARDNFRTTPDSFRLTLKSDHLVEGEKVHHLVGESVTRLRGSKRSMEPKSSLESSVGIKKPSPVCPVGSAQPAGTICFQAEAPPP